MKNENASLHTPTMEKQAIKDGLLELFRQYISETGNDTPEGNAVDGSLLGFMKWLEDISL